MPLALPVSDKSRPPRQKTWSSKHIDRCEKKWPGGENVTLRGTPSHVVMLGKGTLQGREKVGRATSGPPPDQVSSPRPVVLVHRLLQEEPVTLAPTPLLVPVAFPQSATKHSVR
jgi:hypothetical protein